MLHSSPDYSRIDEKLRIKLLKIFYLYEIMGSPDLDIGECIANFALSTTKFLGE